MIKVEGHKNLYRDETSNAIVNCNDTEYQNYLNLKRQKELQKKEIEDIKIELDEIKTLLKELINGSK